MSSRKTLSKIECGGDDMYMMCTVHKEGEKGFDLALSEGTTAYTAKVTGDDLQKMSRKAKMNFDDYLAQTLKALTRENVGSFNFQYQIKDAAGGHQFTWKKHMTSENIKFQLGTVKLKEEADPSPVIKALFEQCVSGTTRLRETISGLQADKERLATERTNALIRLDKCVTAKDNLETHMFAKFMTIVNDKKAKIRSLKDDLDEMREAGPSTSQTRSNPQKRKTRDSEEEQQSSDAEVKKENNDDLASDYNTDEDEMPVSKKSKTVTVKKEVTSPGDDLFLDAGDDDDAVPTTSRRRRRQLSSKKQTPSKPIIPKVQSTSKDKESPITPSTSRRSSMRKTTSAASSRSSDNFDPDDLIAEMK